MEIDRNQSEAFEALDERLLKVSPCADCVRLSSLARTVDSFVRCGQCRRRLLEEVLHVAAMEVCEVCDRSGKRPLFKNEVYHFYHLVADGKSGHKEEWCPAANLWKLIRAEGS